MGGARRTDAEIERAILDALAAAGPARSIAPADAARRLDAAAWRGLLAPVRRVAAIMAGRGELEILRKGRAIHPDDLRGVIRLRRRGE
jgi:hypothetical protein